MHVEKLDPGDHNKMAALFGPGMVEQYLYQTIQFCWMSLPADRRNLDELEKDIRRRLDRVLRELREDEDRRKGG